MITLTTEQPRINITSAASFKINSDREIYGDTCRFYTNERGGIISLPSGGGCSVCGDFESEELTAFFRFVKPKSVFCDGADCDLDLEGYTTYPVTVLKREGGGENNDNAFSFDLSSDKIYAILKAANAFILPSYEYFAVDFCRRTNRGALMCAASENRTAAIAFICGNAALLCGVASCEKGMGGRVLQSLLSNLGGKMVFVAARGETAPFYIKNGFTPVGAGICYEKTVGEENELFYF